MSFTGDNCVWKESVLMQDNEFDDVIINHYIRINILTNAFRSQIESTLNVRCLACNNFIFSDNPTYQFCDKCGDEMEKLALDAEEE